MNEPDRGFYKTSKFDLVVISLVILFSGGMVARSVWQSAPASEALIYKDSRLLRQVSLAKDRVFDIDGGKMRIQVKGNRIKISGSDCPQHVCVHTGWIQYSGQTIVCVPNKVVIEVKSGRPAPVDVVAY